ncbi:MAG: transposase [Candidatus Parabeggiatoa sp.]|nr:transposase [Candidatus Parabeggiatoa sp.]
MSRRSRLKLDGISIHIIQRGNNRNACFYADEDDPFYLDSLEAYCHDEEVKVHAYVLMTNHVHLLVTPTDGNGPSRVMKRLGQHYVQYIKGRFFHGKTLQDTSIFRALKCHSKAFNHPNSVMNNYPIHTV